MEVITISMKNELYNQLQDIKKIKGYKYNEILEKGLFFILNEVEIIEQKEKIEKLAKLLAQYVQENNELKKKIENLEEDKKNLLKKLER